MTALTLPGALLPDAMGREDVARAVAGDMAAFERLYRAHVAKIHSLVRRMAGPGDADDLTQDIFLRAWSRLGTFRGESAFGTWLHRLAVNVVIERLRSPVARLRWVDDEEALQGVMFPGSHGTRMDLEAALQQLPAGARGVFVLHDVEGHTHQEIANLLGVSVGTSKAQLHRARMLMRRTLGNGPARISNEGAQ
jgi:RNA polymerase sigma-70 factor (ECF subfamily)